MRKAAVGFIMSVCPFVRLPTLTGRILIKFYISVSFENLSWKFKFH